MHTPEYFQWIFRPPPTSLSLLFGHTDYVPGLKLFQYIIPSIDDASQQKPTLPRTDVTPYTEIKIASCSAMPHQYRLEDSGQEYCLSSSLVALWARAVQTH